MEYKEYLKTDHWRRLSAKKRKHAKCGICGIRRGLQTHHIKYTRKGKNVLFNETPGILRVLCRDCHPMWHRIQGRRVYRGKHGGRIKHLRSIGYDKEFAFINCVGKDYKAAKKAAKRSPQAARPTRPL